VFRYVNDLENWMQWMVLLLVIVALLPQTWLEAHDGAEEARNVQKHLAAFTFLIAFIEVSVPNLNMLIT
jgi:hypothetical protein